MPVKSLVPTKLVVLFSERLLELSFSSECVCDFSLPRPHLLDPGLPEYDPKQPVPTRKTHNRVKNGSSEVFRLLNETSVEQVQEDFGGPRLAQCVRHKESLP